MTEKHNYTVDLNWREGRIGSLSSPDLDPRIEVATPPEFEGGDPGIWSPEHLFVASVRSCLITNSIKTRIHLESDVTVNDPVW